MSYFTRDYDPATLQLIWREWFAPHNGVIAITDGPNDIINGRLHLGIWAGPSATVFNLCHEMAHFIEIDNRRCHLPGWGLKTGKTVLIGSQLVPEGMHTTQAIERE